MKLLVIAPALPDKENRSYGGIFVKEQVKALSKYVDEINVMSSIPISFGLRLNDKICKDYCFSDVNVYFPRFFHLLSFHLLTDALLGLLNGLREMKKYASTTILQSVLMVIITVTLIYHGFVVAGAVIGIVLASLSSYAFLTCICIGVFQYSTIFRCGNEVINV